MYFLKKIGNEFIENQFYFKSKKFPNSCLHAFFKIGKNSSFNVSNNYSLKSIILKNRIDVLNIFLNSESNFYKKDFFSKTPIFFPLQNHTNNVIDLDKNLNFTEIINKNKFEDYENFYQNEIFKIDCDSFITSQKNVPIGVFTADCVPILLCTNDLIGAIHSGWRGAANGIISKTVSIMKKKLNKKNLKISAIIGPSIFSKNYEVTDEFIDCFKNDFDCFERNKSKIFFNLRKKIEKELFFSGVENLYWIDENTYSNTNFASYRRDKKFGENKISQASIIMLV